MQVLHGTGALPLDGAPSVVTVGFFDGVHLGHQAVFRRVVQEATARGLRSLPDKEAAQKQNGSFGQ